MKLASPRGRPAARARRGSPRSPRRPTPKAPASSDCSALTTRSSSPNWPKSRRISSSPTSRRRNALDLYDELNEERGALLAGSRRRLREHSRGHGEAQRRHRHAVRRSPRRNPAEAACKKSTSRRTDRPRCSTRKIAEALKITDEQKTKLGRRANRSLRRFRRLRHRLAELERGGSRRRGRQDDRQPEREVRRRAHRRAERTAFEKLQGEKLEIDLGNLPNPFGG